MRLWKRRRKVACLVCDGKGGWTVRSPFRYPSPSVIGYAHVRAATRDSYWNRCWKCKGKGKVPAV